MKTPIIIIAILAVITFLGSVFIVNQTEQALVLQFGEPKRVVNEPGLHFKLPFFFQNVLKFDKRILDINLDKKEVIASDSKRLIVDAFVKYKIVDPLKFFQAVQNEIKAQGMMSSILFSNLQSEIGKIPLSTLLTEKRVEIMRNIHNNSNAEAKSFGIEIVDVRITRSDLPPENNHTIFERMKAERNKEAKQIRSEGEEQGKIIRATANKERTILLAEAEKKSQLLRGDGEAISTELYAKAFNKDPDFYAFYRSMQAYKKSINNDDTTLVISPDSDFLHFMNRSESK